MFLGSVRLLIAAIAAATLVVTTATARDDGFVPAARQATTVGILSIRGEIDDVTLTTFQRRLEQAAADGCDAVVLEIDTPGGALGPTLAICHLIKTRLPANKVAWVRPQAYSAGIIIALACREIVVAPNAALGDAAPVAALPGLGLQPLPSAERAKIESPVLAEVTDSALRNGHDVRLARAFVRTSDELWLVERDDGVRMFANAEEYRILFGGDPARGSDRFVPDLPPVATLAAPVADPATDPDAERIEIFVLEPRVGPADAGRWRLLGKVDGADQLVTLRGDEAVRFGLAAATIADEEQLRRFLGATRIIRYDETWADAVVRFLVSWPVRGILIVAMLLSFFIEFASPGAGVFGIIGFTAFLLLVGAPAIAGLAAWWEIALIVLGAVLIAIEILVTPGLGVPGIVGAICLLVGLVFSFVGGDLSSSTSRADLLTGLLATLGAFAVAALGVAVLARHLPQLAFVRGLVLDATAGSAEASAPSIDRPVASGPALGAEGIALTDLRPTGRVDLGERVVDARTRGPLVVQGRRVRIVDRDGLGPIVEEIA
jgi:membrane-bound serine protease (ClpP class)